MKKLVAGVGCLKLVLCAVLLVQTSGCSQTQVATTVADLKVACADINTGEAVAVVVDPSLLASSDATAAEVIVTQACAAVNALPAAGAVAAAMAAAPAAAAVNAAQAPVAATPTQ